MAELAEKINRHGLERILIAKAALGAQYVPKKEEIAVKELAAQKEIESWKQMAGLIDPHALVEYVHMSCNTLGKEEISGGQYE